MAVYVDTARHAYRGMLMCHMIADSKKELLAMVDTIGVQRKWIQKEDTYAEHFDICQSKRKLAIRHGAIEITVMELGRILRAKKHG